MNEFKEFNIKATEKGFTGDKIKMSKVLNKKIIVMDYRIKDSKYEEKGNGKCLHMQISIEDKKHVVFTGSSVLQEMIQKIPKENMPFRTTIIEENDRYEFT